MYDIPTMRDVSAFTMVRNLIIGSRLKPGPPATPPTLNEGLKMKKILTKKNSPISDGEKNKNGTSIVLKFCVLRLLRFLLKGKLDLSKEKLSLIEIISSTLLPRTPFC